jgi:hypothetical protein
MIPDIVWEDILDKKFKIQVERLPDPQRRGVWPSDLSRKGLLTISQMDGLKLHSTPVFITWGAPMGPDAGDVEEWKDLGCKWVDARGI